MPQGGQDEGQRQPVLWGSIITHAETKKRDLIQKVLLGSNRASGPGFCIHSRFEPDPGLNVPVVNEGLEAGCSLKESGTTLSSLYSGSDFAQRMAQTEDFIDLMATSIPTMLRLETRSQEGFPRSSKP